MPELQRKRRLEKRLENLSNILEKQLSVEESRQKEVKEEEKERQVVTGGTAVYQDALQNAAGK